MLKALVLVTDGSEEIEAVTVIDILRRAQIQVTVASVKDGLDVLCSRQVKLTADVLFDDIYETTTAAAFDAIVMPGGLKGAQKFSLDENVKRTLVKFEAEGKLIAAMCASTTALQAAGIGKGSKATSYPTFREQLKGFYNYQEEAVVTDNNIITSRGPGTAMAWSLAIVKVLSGQAKAVEIAEQLLFTF